MARNSDEPERPRVEPEIIPPGRADNRGPIWPTPHGFTQARGAQRVFVGRIGPLGFALLLLVAGLFGSVFLLLLIGAALLWIPIVAVLVAVAALAGLMRRI